MAEKLNWGFIIAFYLFLGGLSAAAFYVAAIADYIGKDRFKNVSRIGAYIVPVPIIIGIFMLIMDLGKPQKFWYLMFQTGPINQGLIFQPGSALSIGIWLLDGFLVICGLVYPLMWLAEEKIGRNIPLISAFAGKAELRRKIALLGLPFSILVAVYTGVLMAATSQPIWSNTPFLPVLFVVSASSTGIAAIIMMMYLTGVDDNDAVIRLEKGDNLLIQLEMAVVALMFAVLFFSSGTTAAAAKLVFGSYSILFWLGFIVVGLLLPYMIQARNITAHGPSAKTLTFVSSILVLLGGFYLRYIILLAV